MASLTEIHEALEARVRTTGIRSFGYPAQGVTFPVALVEVESWQQIAMGRDGTATFRFVVRVFTAQSVRPQDGYRALSQYADHQGDKSIPLAIWDGNDRPAGTFGDLANVTAQVVEYRTLGAVEIDAFQAYGGEFTVDVTTKG